MEQKPKQDIVMLRRNALQLRNGLPPDVRAQKSEEIAEILLCSDAYRHAQSLLVYVSCKTEVSTFSLIDRAIAQEKRVYVPKVEGERISFYRIFSRTEVKPGFRGILEPAGDTAVWNTEKLRNGGGMQRKRSLLLAPGTVFDRFGHRIGYGGGFYDRFLGGIPEPERPYCVGLCFACQLVEQIEPQKHDIAMDQVIYA